MFNAEYECLGPLCSYQLKKKNLLKQFIWKWYV